MDVLTDLLQRSHARGAAFSRSTLHGEWAVEFPRSGTLAIHAIIDGEMTVWTGLHPDPVRVAGGDVLLLHAYPHYLASATGLPTVPYRDLMDAATGDTGRSRTKGTPQDGAAGQFFCGAYVFDGDLSRPLIASLPPLVRLRPAAGSRLRASIDLLLSELDADGPGQQALLDRLLDVVLVQALRAWFSQADAAIVPGWLRAMDEPGLAAALQAMHDDPAKPWTVADLAGVAGQSRSGFSRSFAQKVGTPPLGYLTDWRLALAKERLRDTDDGLAAIAASVGYGSEFSFAAAFKRRVGTAPGQWRRDQPGPGPGAGFGAGTAALP